MSIAGTRGKGRAERLHELTQRLSVERKIEKSEALRIAGVTSQSSFKRIKDYLKNTGLPVSYDANDGCYHVAPNATTPRYAFDARQRSQVAQLRTIASALGPVIRDTLEDVLAPFEAQIALDDPDARATFTLRQPQPRADAALFTAIDRAITATREHRWISFDYRKSPSEAPTRRTLAPYSLHLHDGRYYLWGLPEGELQPKLFALDLAQDLEIEEDSFDPDPGLSLDDELRASFGVMIGSGPPQRIVVRIAAAAANFVRCRRWPAEVAMRDDGDEVVVEFDVSLPDEVVAWVLSFGGAATVESPEDVRAIVRARARAIADAHAPALTQPTTESFEEISR